MAKHVVSKPAHGKGSKMKGKEFDKDGRKDGRIGKLSGHVVAYYRNIEEKIKTGFEDEEEKEIMMDNVVRQMCREATTISRNQTCSKIVEFILYHITPVQITLFANALAKDWVTMIKDRCASYVVQSTIMLLPSAVYAAPSGDKIEDPVKSDDTDTCKSAKELLDELFVLCLESFDELLRHTYGSHIIRAILQVSSGIIVPDTVVRSRLSIEAKKDSTLRKIELPSNLCFDYKDTFKTLREKLQSFCASNPGCFTESLVVPVIQTLLLVLESRKKKLSKCVDTLINKTDLFSTDVSNLSMHDTGSQQKGIIRDVPLMFTHEVGSRLIETVLHVLTEEQMSDIYQRFFKDKVLQLSTHPVSNYVVQRLLEKLYTKEQFVEVFDEIKSKIEDILALEQFGVVWKIAEACNRLQTKQQKFIKVLHRSFHSLQPLERQEKLAQLLLAMLTYEQYSESAVKTLPPIHYHGSLIVRALLKFEKPQTIADGLVSLSSSELLTVSCDPNGSHVIDVFVQSETIDLSTKTTIYEKLKSCYVSMACHRNGSRAVDNMWNAASIENKTLMAECLSKQAAKLQSDRYGRFVHKNCSIHQFINHRSEWKSAYTDKKRKKKQKQDQSSGKKKKIISTATSN